MATWRGTLEAGFGEVAISADGGSGSWGDKKAVGPPSNGHDVLLFGRHQAIHLANDAIGELLDIFNRAAFVVF